MPIKPTLGLGIPRSPGTGLWYKNANLKLNNALPSYILDFKNNRYYNSTVGSRPIPFTNVRTTNATMHDAQGRTVWAPANMATNTTIWGAGFSLDTATLTPASGIIAPTGETAYNFVGSNGASTTGNDQVASVVLLVSAVTSGAPYGYSFYAKANTLTSLKVRENTVSGARASINLIDGTVVYESGNASGMAVLTQDIGNGWWRILLNRAASGTQQRYSIKPGQTTCDGVSGVYIASPQFEALGIDSPKTYIPTGANAYYGPRLDYDPVTFAPMGLLVEDARTNLISSYNSTQVSNATLSTGVLKDAVWQFQRVTADGTSNPHFGFSQPITPGATESRRVSCVVRAPLGETRIQLSTSSAYSDAANSYVNFGLTGNGSILATGSAASVPFIIPLGGGYYHIGYNYTTNGAPGSGTGAVLFFITANTDIRGPTNTSTSAIDVAFYENVLGSGWGSLTPTFGASATRASDLVSEPIGAWYDQTTGTIYTEYIFAPYTNFGAPIINRFDDGTNNNLIHTYTIPGLTGTQAGLGIVAGGTSQVNGNVANPNAYLSTIKAAFNYKTNDAKWTQNGGAVQTDTTCTIPIGITTLRLGSNTTPAILGARWLREVRYYADASVSNTQLQTLTS